MRLKLKGLSQSLYFFRRFSLLRARITFRLVIVIRPTVGTCSFHDYNLITIFAVPAFGARGSLAFTLTTPVASDMVMLRDD